MSSILLIISESMLLSKPCRMAKKHGCPILHMYYQLLPQKVWLYPNTYAVIYIYTLLSCQNVSLLCILHVQGTMYRTNSEIHHFSSYIITELKYNLLVFYVPLLQLINPTSQQGFSLQLMGITFLVHQVYYIHM